jgi:hypothetical protein
MYRILGLVPQSVPADLRLIHPDDDQYYVTEWVRPRIRIGLHCRTSHCATQWGSWSLDKPGMTPLLSNDGRNRCYVKAKSAFAPWPTELCGWQASTSSARTSIGLDRIYRTFDPGRGRQWVGKRCPPGRLANAAWQFIVKPLTRADASPWKRLALNGRTG